MADTYHFRFVNYYCFFWFVIVFSDLLICLDLQGHHRNPLKRGISTTRCASLISHYKGSHTQHDKEKMLQFSNTR